MTKFDHPNLLRCYDFLSSSNNYYFITDKCDSDLEKYLGKQPNNQLGKEEGLKTLIQIINGLQYLYNNKITHRDLKPENILIKDGVCIIADFGFAKEIGGSKILVKTILGTPLFMSPEVLMKKPYTSKNDVWALGCIAYEIFHGKLPYTARSESDLLNKIKKTKLKYNI